MTVSIVLVFKRHVLKCELSKRLKTSISFENCTIVLPLQAATHIHRFRSLDENVLRMSELASEGTDFSLKLLSCGMGKPTICIGENKGADQLRSNCEADQRLCFRYIDSAIPLLSKSKISSL